MSDARSIYIAGHTGMVGSAFKRHYEKLGTYDIITSTRDELNLLDQKATYDFLAEKRPNMVVVAAAKVGGIHANNTYRGEFIYENMQMALNIIHGSYLAGVDRLLFLGSSCIYPKLAPQPLKEEYLLTGELEPTNEAYAIAKIASIKVCQSYMDQYGVTFLSAMPTSLYGPNDNFDLENSHVLPALIRKFHLQKHLANNDIEAIKLDMSVHGNLPESDSEIATFLEKKGIKKDSVEVWGTGSPRREFMHVDDVAAAGQHILENYNERDIINIGIGEDRTIKELVELVREIVNPACDIYWNDSYPDGTPRKLMDSSRLESLGWKWSIDLRAGLQEMYNWYLAQL